MEVKHNQRAVINHQYFLDGYKKGFTDALTNANKRYKKEILKTLIEYKECDLFYNKLKEPIYEIKLTKVFRGK